MYVMAGFLIASCASAQGSTSFGLVKGTTIQQLKSMGAVYQEEYRSWKLKDVPTPNAAFEYYTVKATDKDGVCQVTGIGDTVATDPAGNKLKSKFKEFHDVLKVKYGPSEDYDDIDSDSKLSGTKDWMSSLEQEDRYLESYWSLEDGSNLPSDLIEIAAIAGALSPEEGYVNVRYRFDNYEACKSELDKVNGDGF